MKKTMHEQYVQSHSESSHGTAEYRVLLNKRLKIKFKMYRAKICRGVQSQVKSNENTPEVGDKEEILTCSVLLLFSQLAGLGSEINILVINAMAKLLLNVPSKKSASA